MGKKNRKPIISMIWGFSDVSMNPKTNIICFLRHQDISKYPRNNHRTFLKICCFCKPQRVGNWHVFLKRPAPTIHKDPSNQLGNSWIWDQSLPENMKWAFGNMGSTSSKKHQMNFESLELWKPINSETKKPGNLETKTPRTHEGKTLWNQETLRPRNQETKKPRN